MKVMKRDNNVHWLRGEFRNIKCFTSALRPEKEYTREQEYLSSSAFPTVKGEEKPK